MTGSPHDDDFHTVVVIKMNVLRTLDFVMEIVLNAEQLRYDTRFVVVIDQRNRSGDVLAFRPFLLDEGVPHRNLDRLGTRRKSLFRRQGVKPLQEVRLHGNANSCNGRHRKGWRKDSPSPVFFALPKPEWSVAKRGPYISQRRTASVTFCPPNPKLLLSATSHFAFRATFGT